MKILLTGAHGLTGRHFSTSARTAGHEIVELQADLTDRAAVTREVLASIPEAVVHLAAISFVGHTNESAFYAVNTLGSTHLLDALGQLPGFRGPVLVASSANVYGNSDQSPLTETETPAPVNHYAMSKLAMEYMARNYMDRLDIIITRPFNYTGPGQSDSFLIPKLANHFAARAQSVALGNLHVEREFNDVRMVSDAYLFLLRHGEAGEIYNVCSGHPYTLQQVIDTFIRLTGHSITVETHPALIRPNEVHRLCGNPAKLQALFAGHGEKLTLFSLEDTLQRMLGSGEQFRLGE